MADPTTYGKRLVPQILDSLARAEPNRIMYSVALDSKIAEGFRHVSAGEFAKAVDELAWLLHGQIGDSPSIEPVGYIGPRKYS